MKTVNYIITVWKPKHTLSFISRTGTRHGTRITLSWAIASRTQSWCGLRASTCGSSLRSTAFICTAMPEVGCPSLHSAVPSWWDRPLRPVNVIQACPGFKCTSFVGYKTRVLKQSEWGGLGRLRGRVHTLVTKEDSKRESDVCNHSLRGECGWHSGELWCHFSLFRSKNLLFEIQLFLRLFRVTQIPIQSYHIVNRTSSLQSLTTGASGRVIQFSPWYELFSSLLFYSCWGSSWHPLVLWNSSTSCWNEDRKSSNTLFSCSVPSYAVSLW